MSSNFLGSYFFLSHLITVALSNAVNVKSFMVKFNMFYVVYFFILVKKMRTLCKEICYYYCVIVALCWSTLLTHTPIFARTYDIRVRCSLSISHWIRRWVTSILQRNWIQFWCAYFVKNYYYLHSFCSKTRYFFSLLNYWLKLVLSSRINSFS